jgi:hypothetical protein
MGSPRIATGLQFYHQVNDDFLQDGQLAHIRPEEKIVNRLIFKRLAFNLKITRAWEVVRSGDAGETAFATALL